ncbi:MAG: 50S ribosomal protein L11 methyltransferase [Betaproteobacteria bacterium]|nr:50S ribosomal protein L11 methyltransferase [Betaproteobacteria bacterium]
MAWQSVTLHLTRETADIFSDTLLELGAISVNVEDADEGTVAEKPIFGEPGASTGLWDLCKIEAIFADDADVSKIIQAAGEVSGGAIGEYHVAPLEDVDWVQQSRDQFQPIAISDRVWIVPTWHSAPDAGAINIALDPGAAFGTGSHPTTRLCLQWLEAHLLDKPGISVLDYGCGSGILAIAARKFGASRVVGVDIDPHAIEVARFNAAQNGVEIDFSTTDAHLDFVADVTVANILANPLKVLAPLLAAHTTQHLVLAGLLDAQAEELIEIYRPWFNLSVWKSEEGWSCLAGTRLES